jgi:hypothetical protein
MSRLPSALHSRSRASEIALRLRIGFANFAGDPPRFFFERADGEFGARLTLKKILPKVWLEAAASFALRNMSELVQDQLAITPTVATNNNAMADGHAAGRIGDYMSAARGLSQLRILRQKNTVDDQYFDPRAILNADSTRIGDLPWS